MGEKSVSRLCIHSQELPWNSRTPISRFPLIKEEQFLTIFGNVKKIYLTRKREREKEKRKISRWKERWTRNAKSIDYTNSLQYTSSFKRSNYKEHSPRYVRVAISPKLMEKPRDQRINRVELFALRDSLNACNSIATYTRTVRCR